MVHGLDINDPTLVCGAASWRWMRSHSAVYFPGSHETSSLPLTHPSERLAIDTSHCCIGRKAGVSTGVAPCARFPGERACLASRAAYSPSRTPQLEPGVSALG